MKLIYIAGPFRAATPWLVEQNIRRAEELAYRVWTELGTAALCPHTNTRFFDKSGSDQVFLDGTMEMLRRCDAVLLVPGYEKSAGTIAEMREAQRLGTPVFHNLAGLSDWLGRAA